MPVVLNGTTSFTATPSQFTGGVGDSTIQGKWMGVIGAAAVFLVM